MNKRRVKRSKPNIYINIAPLVEVMLVLIIIFMITAPMLNVGIQVDLPKTQGQSLNDSKTPPIIITIDKDTNIFIEEAEITLPDLIQKLPLILENGKSDTIYIRGDKELQYGKIMEIMGIISTAGACKVSLISEPESTSNAPQSTLVKNHDAKAPTIKPPRGNRRTSRKPPRSRH
ncbi:MAG: biopolymer transporter ExbD [Holosporales bacterium]|jgi:biopolymer transport protein TolR|nr:biopolymer transporter ExbD [Holosporales bacterium]